MPHNSGVADELTRPVWAEIDLAAIRHNVHVLQERNGQRALMAVVKANGYGHGAVAVAEAALSAGVVWLGVATPEEGLALRHAGIKAPILVLGAFYPGAERAYLEGGLTATLATFDAIDALSQLANQGCVITTHLKIDTGMGRIGFLPGDAVAAAHRAVVGGVRIDGVYTHLATADEEDTLFAQQQLTRFRAVIAALDAEGIRPAWRHAGNSAALLQLPLDGFNLTRAGIALYGLPPSPYLAGKAPLHPALSWHARVVAVRRLPAGSAISYGSRYITPTETTIAVLPLGYADGYTRRMTHKAQVLLHGRRFPVVGTICMDQCMVDVGDTPVAVGDEAVLIGKQDQEHVTADEMADWSGTINYEVVCGIGSRVPRVWLDTERATQ